MLDPNPIASKPAKEPLPILRKQHDNYSPSIWIVQPRLNQFVLLKLNMRHSPDVLLVWSHILERDDSAAVAMKTRNAVKFQSYISELRLTARKRRTERRNENFRRQFLKAEEVRNKNR